MSQLTLPYGHYLLQLRRQPSAIQIHLAPTHSSSELSFIYAVSIHLQNIDSVLKFLFTTIENLWIYLNFHQQKAIVVDLTLIQTQNLQLNTDYQADPNRIYDRFAIDLPISIKLIMLEGIGTEVRLKGYTTLQTLQVRLTKILQENRKLKSENQSLQNQNESLKNQLASPKLPQIQQLQQENQQLKRKLETYENDRFQSHQSMLPRKKIHLSNDFKPNPSEVYDIIIQTEKPTAPQDSLNAKKPHYDIIQEQSSSSRSSSLGNEDKMNSSQSSSLKTSKANELPSEQQKVSEPQSQKQSVNSSKNEKNSSHRGEKSMDEDEYDLSGIVDESIYSLRDKALIEERKQRLLESDQAKMIEAFTSKCLTSVGFNQKSESKRGYVCVFCEKIFKQPEFLSKHIFSRHQEVLESHVDETYLMGKLNQYTMKREVTAQTELRNKKMERMTKGLFDSKENR